MNNSTRDQLVADYLPLVGYLVSDLCARATHLDRDELASVGQFALFQASRSFDPDRGVPFAGYARTRISGALADELRSRDWVSRGTRKRIKETLAVGEGLAASLGRSPEPEEIAAALGTDKQTVIELMQRARSGPITLDDRIDELTSAIVGPEESAEVRERDAFLRRAVEALPERQRLIVTRIYFEDKQVKDVAAELGVTHAAVSLARTEAMKLLQEGWLRHFDATGAGSRRPAEGAPTATDAAGATPASGTEAEPKPGTKRYAYLTALATSGPAGGSGADARRISA